MRGVPRGRFAISMHPAKSAAPANRKSALRYAAAQGGIKLQPRHNAEAVAKRVGRHAGTGRRPDQREWRQISDGAGSGAFPDHYRSDNPPGRDTEPLPPPEKAGEFHL